MKDWLRHSQHDAHVVAFFCARAERLKDAVPVALIIAVTARHFDMTVEEMLTRRRTARFMVPRHVAMYLAKQLTMRSLPDIGRRFAGRDHTTIIHGCEKVRTEISRDERVRREVAAVLDALRAPS